MQRLRSTSLPGTVLGVSGLLPVAAAGGALLLYLASEIYFLGGRLGLPLDDAFIHLQFARQLAAGEGLTYNPGQWVTGSSAPLWTALLAATSWLPGSSLLWAKLLGAACFVLSVDATARLGAELGLRRGLALLAATLVATTHWLVWAALSGMEVTLFTSLALWGTILHLRERASPPRPPLALPVLALACLARPEGLVLLAAAFADRVFAALAGRRRPGREALGGILAGLGPAVVVLLPTLLLYRVSGGTFLPSTFHAKAPQALDLWPSGRYLRAVIDVIWRSQPITLWFAGAGALRLFERLGTARDRGVAVALWVFGLPFCAALVAGERGPVLVGNFGRYFFPLLPFVVVLGLLGWERLARRLPRQLRLVLVVAVLLPQLWGLARGAAAYVQTIANVEDSDVAAARWLAPRLDGAAPLAVQDVGALKYLLPNPVIDLAGIVNPAILPYLHGRDGEDPRDWQRRLLQYLATVRPAYLVVFPTAYPQLVHMPGFELVRAFTVRDNVTMAGDELAIYSTPWTGELTLHEPPEDAGSGP